MSAVSRSSISPATDVHSSQLVSGTFLGVAGVPLMGLGLAALGRPGYINVGHALDVRGTASSSNSSSGSSGNDSSSSSSSSKEHMRAHCWEMLDAAWGSGIRYFDAARSYGLAEEFLGGWLRSRQIAPAAVLCGSKWGYTYTADWQVGADGQPREVKGTLLLCSVSSVDVMFPAWRRSCCCWVMLTQVDTQGQPHEVKDLSAANLLRQVALSDELLGTHLRLYQIHSATLESGVMDDPEVLAALADMRASRGWRVGLSVTGVHQADTIRKALQVRTTTGDVLFDSVQATYNLLEQSAGPALAEAHALGVSVIVKEAMANGRLTGRYPAPHMAGRQAVLQRVAAKHGATVDAVCLAACHAQHQFRPMVLSGAASLSQLHSNLTGGALAAALGDAELEALMAEMVQEPKEYWTDRSALAWN